MTPSQRSLTDEGYNRRMLRSSRIVRGHPVALGLTAVVLLVGAAIAGAAIGRDGAKPPPKPLAVAVHDALAARTVPGITARIRFDNRLISSGALPRGTSSPLISGASGRGWMDTRGRFRLELQSDDGDVQVVSNGRTLTMYDGKANTLYTAALPHERGHDHRERTPGLAEVRRGLGRLGRHATISGAQPTNVAGRPAYQVRLSPKHDGGLLAALTVAWDATRGVPLRVALTAQGSDEPVLELQATDISYGAVSESRFRAPAVPGAKRVRVDLPTGARAQAAAGKRREIAGVRAVGRSVGFSLRAPDRLVGLRRQAVRLVSGGTPSDSKALVLYGQGLGGIAVLQAPAKADAARAVRQLQRVTIDGATGHELSTPLGTFLTWTSGGVTYTLVGSLPASAAEVAARELAAAP
jgi:outer membrane lipoprotein-sorting protein